MSIQKKVGEKVKSARLENKISQQELAKKADTTQKWIWSLESGKQNITISSLSRIAEALDKKLKIDLE